MVSLALSANEDIITDLVDTSPLPVMAGKVNCLPVNKILSTGIQRQLHYHEGHFERMFIFIVLYVFAF